MLREEEVLLAQAELLVVGLLRLLLAQDALRLRSLAESCQPLLLFLLDGHQVQGSLVVLSTQQAFLWHVLFLEFELHLLTLLPLRSGLEVAQNVRPNRHLGRAARVQRLVGLPHVDLEPVDWRGVRTASVERGLGRIKLLPVLQEHLGGQARVSAVGRAAIVCCRGWRQHALSIEHLVLAPLGSSCILLVIFVKDASLALLSVLPAGC